jgi:hypothetical protein
MNKKYFMKAICLIFLVAGFGIAATSCGSDEEEEDLFTRVQTNSLPIRLVEKSQMPEWLADLVTKAESADSEIPTGTRPIRVYTSVWNGSNYYTIFDGWASSWIFEQTYSQDGARIDWRTVNSGDFYSESRNWACIYIIRE